MKHTSTISTWLHISAKIGSWLFAVVTVLWMGVAVFFWADSIIKQKTWEKAAAIVTKIAEDDRENSNIQYSYFTFTDTERGKEYTVKSKMGSSEMPIYELGSKVEVIYPANNPAEAEENTFIVQYILPLGFTFVAFMAGFFTLVLWVIYRKTKRG